MIESKPSSVMAPVLGFPSYLVSSEGVVYRKDSMRALAQQKSRKGYLTVNMSEGGRATRLSVHRVVLESFVGFRPEGMQALHGDGNPSNNRLENLRWGNASENEADKLLHGTKATGSRNGAARLTEEMVAEILEAKRVGGKEWGAGRLAKKFGVAVSTVVRAGRGKHWSSSRAALATQPAGGEPVAWRMFDGEGGYDFTEDEELANAQLKIRSAQGLANWVEPLFTAAAHGDEAVRWVPCSERLPEVAQFDQQEFIVSVQRKDKVITMSALYLNAYPLYCEDHDDADEEGYVPHTGWYDAKSNGDDANCYTLVNDSWYGSTVTHWMPMPKPAAAMRAQGDVEVQ